LDSVQPDGTAVISVDITQPMEGVQSEALAIEDDCTDGSGQINILSVHPDHRNHIAVQPYPVRSVDGFLYVVVSMPKGKGTIQITTSDSANGTKRMQSCGAILRSEQSLTSGNTWLFAPRYQGGFHISGRSIDGF
jgi:hypothetical protein